ncbi:MAG: hypothetical protein WAT39_01780 [Planctomycetota bacterium]
MTPYRRCACLPQPSGLLLAAGAVLWFACLGSAQVAGATAAPSPRPRATVHLPAGDYSIAELISQAEQASRCRITLPAGFAAASGRLHLQTAVALDAEGWQVVVGTILWSRGLVLARKATANTYEILPTPADQAAWIADLAEDTSLTALYSRHPYGPVTVTLPIREAIAGTRSLVSAAFFGRARQCEVGGVPGAITLTGLGRDVRLALEGLAKVLPNLLPPQPPPAVWPRPGGEPLELRQGSYTARNLVDLLASALQRNVLAGTDSEFLAAPIEVAATQRVDPLRLEEVVTRLLWEAGILIVELTPQRDLFQAILVRQGQQAGGDALLAAPVATPMTAREVLARRTLVAFAVVGVQLQRVTQEEAIAAWEDVSGIDVRMGVNGRPRQIFCEQPDLRLSGFSVPGTYWMRGLTVELLPMLDRLAQLEAEAAAKK